MNSCSYGCLEFIVCEWSGRVIHKGIALPSSTLYGISENMSVILFDFKKKKSLTGTLYQFKTVVQQNVE